MKSHKELNTIKGDGYTISLNLFTWFVTDQR